MPDFSNDRFFTTHEWEDETSMFDPRGVWSYGCECYFRTYKCRIPKRIENNSELIEKWMEKYYEWDGFWVN